jgi:tRNA (guanine-N7-)-methyltransferase
MDESTILIPELIADRRGWEVSIGAGKGRYILARAGEQPTWGFLAVEVKARLCRLIEERAERRHLDNLCVIRADARRLLARLGPPGVLDRASVHFPDPWWKKKHAKRAVLTPATLERIALLLRPGGEIYVATDVFDRARSFLGMLTAEPGLRNASPAGGLLEERITGCTSNREQQCMQSGLPVFRMLFVKLGRPQVRIDRTGSEQG